MSLVYRTVFQVPPDTVPAEIDALFKDWVASKHRGLTVPGELLDSQGREVAATSHVEASRESVHASRAVLRETSEAEHWTTTVTTVRDADRGWLWVDVERVATDIYTYRPTIAAPRLVLKALETFECASGGRPLTAGVELVEGRDAGALIERLLDRARELPVVVVSEAPSELRTATAERAQLLVRRIGGLASVVQITPGAAKEIERVLGRALSTYDGAIRTYFPGFEVTEVRPWRHPYLTHYRLREMRDQGTGAIAQGLAGVLAHMRPPRLYRQEVRAFPGFPADPNRDPTSFIEQIGELQEELEAVRSELSELQDEWTLRGMELEDEQRANDKARARIRYLESQLRVADVGAAGDVAEEPFQPATCVGVLKHARSVLSRVVIPVGVDDAASDLDRDANSGLYASKTWRLLQALEAYAVVRGERPDSFATFLEYCREADSTEPTFPVSKIALTESETTDNNARYRALRILPVSRQVDPEGKKYMPAHAKIDMGGVFPRLHFYDDTRGNTGKMHVGYFGRHFDSVRKN